LAGHLERIDAAGVEPTNPMPSPPDRASPPSLLQPGRNCWRIEHARRFSLLVDADAYFRAVRAAVREARHSVFILSWDIDSRMRLVPGGADDGWPEPLGDFLHAVVSARKGLRAHILNWDYAMLYALEREWLPHYKLGWRTHRRLAFRMDGRHPVGASHHQKIVVVDDAVAFVGGLDLTRCRWDTAEHACQQDLRCDPDGKAYPPFHDVQAVLDGDAARALGELVRQRWRRAGGRKPLALAPAGAYDPWPAGLAADLTDVQVGIARTEPPFDGRPAVQEVRCLHEDAIAAAQRDLFFENQYFTSSLVADALAKRLREPHGPEVVVVSRRMESGWLEEATMGVLRCRLHKRLRLADGEGRYRMYCPHIPGLEKDCLNVHSKVMAMDDRLFTVGSANLSNRSMVLDTECNLVVEARGDGPDGQRVAQAIRNWRQRLLAEHLAVQPAQVDEAMRRHGRLIAAVEALRGPGRSLDALEPACAPEIDALVPEHALIDPERPVAAEELIAQVVPEEAHAPVPRRLIGIGLLMLALGLAAVAWRATPLRELVQLETLTALAQRLEALPFSAVAVMAAYVVGGLLVVPVTAMIAVTGMVFGPLLGGAYALAGALLSAACTYGAGRWLGQRTVRRLVGARINRLSRRIARQGIVAMVIVRLLPLAPFTVVNVVAGASHIRLRDFLLGTAIGMAPGIFLTVTFVHQLIEAVQRPSAWGVAVLAVLAALLIGLALVLQRVLHKHAALAS
jgi:phospholipase D1/2